MVSADNNEADGSQASSSQVKLSIELGRSVVSGSQAGQLDVGSVIELDTEVDESVELRLNDQLVAKGTPIVVDEEIGFQTQEIINRACEAARRAGWSPEAE